MNSAKKVIRHERLFKMLQRNPFLTDEQLAKNLAVSIQTIRLDRLSLNIPELRERTRQMAHSGISMLKITPDMVLEKTGVARGYYMFAMANTLALAVVDAEAALTGVGNVKYKVPVYAGATLVAKAEVIRRELNKYIIWVKIRNNNEEVFRAKFIIVPCPDERTTQAYENRA